ncbi:UbiD family decarboxylase [Geobacter sp. DSM 9736]|uniref:UbiD family decarboxylase n=1 Tax=Geobacter sp. DSM 9736 TaxID=1277350 RepID=UPI000B505D38|nr:UbiD family decarboxylase [Geobacter sp. DSM 9736]SNB47568.1 4-hydroxy-3-polyprenylbenzoate decarboxylase [Geobacter sp. DSM 9736]
MPIHDLHEFLGILEELEELHRVRVEVDPVLEISSITARVSGQEGGGKALLFERVAGSPFQLVTNIFGSPRRMALSLSVKNIVDVQRRMEVLLAGGDPWRKGLVSFHPVEKAGCICQEVWEGPSALNSYPFLKNWPADGAGGGGGRFITLPLVITRDPDDGTINCGMYRTELFDDRTCGIHWRPGSGGAAHYRKYASRGLRTPVAVVVGGDPAAVVAASLPLPEEVDELAFAGFLRGEPLDVARCRTSDLVVPAAAEMVIEGYLEPGEARQGGLFGNHTGFYASAGEVPVLRVLSISRRDAPIFPATVVGRPPMEDCHMAKVMERIMLPLTRWHLPEIEEINLLTEGIFHGCAVISIKKTDPGQGLRVIEKLKTDGWLKGSRLLVVVDADVDPHNLSISSWRVFNNVNWSRDTITYSTPVYGSLPHGGCFGIDATRKFVEEIGSRWPEEIGMPVAVEEMVTRRWREYGL